MTQAVHKHAAGDDKKLQSTLKKLQVNAIPGIEEVNLFKDDGSVIHFTNPKGIACLPAIILLQAKKARQITFVTSVFATPVAGLSVLSFLS